MISVPNEVSGRRELRTRLTAMDTAEATRNVTQVSQEAGTRGRAPVRGVKDSDIPEQYFKKVPLDGKRDRSPLRGVKDSDTPAHFSILTHGGALKDTFSIGEGKREQAPVKGVKDSDDPST